MDDDDDTFIFFLFFASHRPLENSVWSMRRPLDKQKDLTDGNTNLTNDNDTLFCKAMAP
jgi:hypothetical protein